MGKLGHQRGEGAGREDTKGRTSERDCGPLGSRTLKTFRRSGHDETFL